MSTDDKTTDELELVNREMELLSNDLADCPGVLTEAVGLMIDRLAWMAVQLNAMEKDLTENGWTEEGRGGVEKLRPIASAYQSTVKTFSNVLVKFHRLIPKDSAEPDDGFDEFVNSKYDD